MDKEIVKICKDLRGLCLAREKDVRVLMRHGVFDGEETFSGQHGEMKDQIRLAVRHLEDARMRLGKVCQYAGDGVSILDKG